MPGNELTLQQRARVFGAYGHFVDELYFLYPDRFKDWESAQAYAASEFNYEAPPGYDEIKNKTCYISVFRIAFQAGYIDSSRLSALESEAFRQNPLRGYFLAQGLSVDGFVKERFTPKQAPGLYWFFRRDSDGEMDPFRNVAHLMYSLDGINAAGSNNYAKDGYPFLYFATHDLNNSDFVWLADKQCWTRTGDPLLLDICWTPLSVLQGP